MAKFKITIIFLCSFILFAISCSESKTNQYGSPYDDKIPLKTIDIISNTKDINGKIFSFEGEITAQCKDDGCWFKLKDNTGIVLVDLKPYNFRLPLEIVCKKVKLNGRVDTTAQNQAKVDAISVIVSD